MTPSIILLLYLLAHLIILLVNSRTLRKSQAERQALEELRESIKALMNANILVCNHNQKQFYDFRLLVKKYRRETGESWKDA